MEQSFTILCESLHLFDLLKCICTNTYNMFSRIHIHVYVYSMIHFVNIVFVLMGRMSYWILKYKKQQQNNDQKQTIKHIVKSKAILYCNILQYC